MRYHWLAQYLVREKFPRLDEQTRNQIVSEAVCRAWCSFLALDYRLMLSCVDAAAQSKGIFPPEDAAELPSPVAPALVVRTSPNPARVIRLSDYR